MFTRSLTTGVVLATFVALASSAGAAVAKAAPEPAAAGNPGASQVIPTSDGNRGANVPFTEYAAVKAQGNGTAIGPSYNLYTLPAEAVGRTAVTLNGAGQYVEFTLARPANAVDLRYSIPDSAERHRADHAAAGPGQRPGRPGADPDLEVHLVLRQLPVHQQPG